MNNNETFHMTYSAEEQEELAAIRSKYLPREPDKLAQIRSLDAGAGKKASAVSIAVGIIGALLLGAAMSLIMTDFGALLGSFAFPAGIITGLGGIVLLLSAYPLYTRTLKRERERIAPEILRLTGELMR